MHDLNPGVDLYMLKVLETPLLNREEERELALRVRGGDEEARERMIKANLRLVVKMAFEYKDYGLPLLDLIQEGNIGLMKAVERYDPDDSAGAKFSTFASWWIFQAITAALSDKIRLIRVPRHMSDLQRRLRKVTAALHALHGHAPTLEELSVELGIPVEELMFVRATEHRVYSLDGPTTKAHEENDYPFADRIPDPNAIPPDRMMIEGEGIPGLEDIISRFLTEREAHVIRTRFGLGGHEPQTLEEVSHKYGLTRERIRQIQENALRKLKAALERRDRIADDPKHPMRKKRNTNPQLHR
jgi:RNA polymerase primary sigma factor